jgi:hypothetical protein
MRHITMLGLTALLALPGATLGAQEQDTWNWNGSIGEGRRVYVHNVNGRVKVETGSGNAVEVTAVKRWRRGDPDDVRIEARMTSGGNGDVIVCALWGERSTCDEDGIRRNNESWGRRANDVSVDFTVRVPAHARVTANTVNGDVVVAEVRGDVEARTVNGDVEARSTAGRVEARTTNGDIYVAGTLSGPGVEYRTVNGSITIELPADAKADVELRTVNGRISTDFPVTFDGTINPRRINAAIGGGGPSLVAATTNGSIRLRKR